MMGLVMKYPSHRFHPNADDVHIATGGDNDLM
jgi:hypothetical protein